MKISELAKKGVQNMGTRSVISWGRGATACNIRKERKTTYVSATVTHAHVREQMQLHTRLTPTPSVSNRRTSIVIMPKIFMKMKSSVLFWKVLPSS